MLHRAGVFATIVTEQAAEAQKTGIVMIDATHARAHRTASSLAVQKGSPTADRADKGRSEPETARPGGCKGPSDPDVPVGGADLRLHWRAGTACRPGS